MAKIDIYFDPETGDIKVEVDGAGGDCVELTKGLEKLLGIQADAKRNLKPEFYEGGSGKKRTESLRRGWFNHRILEQSYLCALLHLSLTAMTNARLNSISNALNTHEDHL